ncbi:EAL domain-containing protein [Alteribacillus sp. HJP-4]|uniref:sensor domain-containing protein n=1 Tax=Alteribacillus sp. HJP-4 TaxID=2775394 RepID=UPI0035CD36D8
MIRKSSFRILHKKALVIAITYFLAGCMWISLSDQLLLLLASEGENPGMVQTYKGWVYVFVTTILLYAAISLFIEKESNEKKRTLQADRRYRILFNSIPDMLFIAPKPKISTKLIFTEANEAAWRQLGYAKKNIKSFTFEGIAAPSLKKGASAQAQKIAELPECKFDWEWERSDGEILPVEIHTKQDVLSGEPVIIAVARDISAYKKAVEDIHQLSHYDRLTNLPNLRYFREQLTQNIGPNQKIAVITLNINRFRRINETKGLQTGDKILMQISQRIKSILHYQQVLARKANDEFLLFSRFSDDKEIIQLIEHIQSLFQRPLVPVKEEIYILLTAGIAFVGKDGTEADEMIQSADIALSHAKRTGKSYDFYRKGMEQEAKEFYQLENDLYNAVVKKELYLVYQPYVSCQTGELMGVEALVRWKHHEKGSIPPGIFIPVAEDNGYIQTLGHWILHQVCREMAVFLQKKTGRTVSVNISSIQLEDPAFASELYDLVTAYDIEPRQVVLEITERTTMDMKQMMPVLHSLKTMGFPLSLDDFGTGYSSLSQLKDLPIDTLKIDRSFIKDMTKKEQNLAIVKTIIDTADSLNLNVIAEGVENAEQAKQLLTLRCHYFQGYYFAEPARLQELKLGKNA